MELTLKRSSIQHRIDEAKNNVEQILEEVLHWLGEVDVISEQVHELRRESEAKLECGITSCPNPLLRYKLSREQRQLQEKLLKFVERETS
ncbi:hypothetical protein K1719_041598 [Acacia pycnantha]|nr:hypothetical protein K1719_041598 [Acacia pycnantha]